MFWLFNVIDVPESDFEGNSVNIDINNNDEFLIIFIIIIILMLIYIIFLRHKIDTLKNENELLKEQLNNIKESLKDNEK